MQVKIRLSKIHIVNNSLIHIVNTTHGFLGFFTTTIKNFSKLVRSLTGFTGFCQLLTPPVRTAQKIPTRVDNTRQSEYSVSKYKKGDITL
jgi:hypothetical protein